MSFFFSKFIFIYAYSLSFSLKQKCVAWFYCYCWLLCIDPFWHWMCLFCSICMKHKAFGQYLNVQNHYNKAFLRELQTKTWFQWVFFVIFSPNYIWIQIHYLPHYNKYTPVGFTLPVMPHLWLDHSSQHALKFLGGPQKALEEVKDVCVPFPTVLSWWSSKLMDG